VLRQDVHNLQHQVAAFDLEHIADRACFTAEDEIVHAGLHAHLGDKPSGEKRLTFFAHQVFRFGDGGEVGFLGRLGQIGCFLAQIFPRLGTDLVFKQDVFSQDLRLLVLYPFVFDFDDMHAELGLDRADDVALGGCERRFFKGFDHLAFAEPTEIAAVLGRTGVLGVDLRQVGKVGSGFGLLNDVGSLG